MKKYLKRILILSSGGDEHASAIALGLQQKGSTAKRWVGADLPTEMFITRTISNNEAEAGLVDGNYDNDFADAFDVVWNRRLTQAHLPPDWVSVSDMAFAERQLSSFHRSTVKWMGRNAIWANTLQLAEASNDKLAQLSVAKHVGFHIPQTLATNSRDAAIAFLSNCSAFLQEAIFKSFTHARWRNVGPSAFAQTSRVTVSDIPSSTVFAASPGIFQILVEKKSEVRAYFLGATVFAMEIDSQCDTRGVTDWRSIPTNALKTKVIALPNGVYTRCLEVMRHFGLITASFDFVITPKDEYVFLEFNEAGQFLWMEGLLPDQLPLLDATTAFLQNPSPSFAWNESMRTHISINDPAFEKAWNRDRLENAGAHVHRPVNYMDETHEGLVAYRQEAASVLLQLDAVEEKQYSPA
jgi:glutathione synthase/RimK-type ligase-like ATP-grasp enzyme